MFHNENVSKMGKLTNFIFLSFSTSIPQKING